MCAKMQEPNYYFCQSSALQATTQGKERHPFMATAIPGPGPAGQGLGGVPSYMDYECYDYKPSSDSEYYGAVGGDQNKREQKRRPKPKDGSQLVCGVCGDKALGYNFDAITCESCKAFFRRNALKSKMLPGMGTGSSAGLGTNVFTCSFDGNCKLDTHTRKFCSGCRLKKCFDIGMKKDWILSEDQLAKRRQKPKGPGEVRTKQRKTSLDEYQNQTSNMEVTSNYMMEDQSSNKSSEGSSSPFKCEMEEDNNPIPLDEQIQKEIENLEYQYKLVFDTPYSDDQIDKLTTSPKSPNDLFNMTDLFVRRLIRFAKHIPEFKTLAQEDQIHLLKGGIMEIMVLRSAMGFDSSQMGWKVKGQSMGEKTIGPQMIQNTLGNGMYIEHIKFVMSLNQLTQANKTIMTLLFVIELFSSDRPNVKNKELVSQGQEKFSTWLKAYLESLHPLTEARSLYPKLLMKLLDVRSLGESSAQMAAHLDITRLEPLLVEVFSLQK
ncbi:nuclear hormone receptor HR96-like [Pecten maximus]|uniref:nuclear hormone receptor HR96-like n=1 Tax=Pecten maximus TaxID=6579 RepID=UPI0014589705|nr:nuclear hormone receptor HR96-like [Pecten maximus]